MDSKASVNKKPLCQGREELLPSLRVAFCFINRGAEEQRKQGFVLGHTPLLPESGPVPRVCPLWAHSTIHFPSEPGYTVCLSAKLAPAKNKRNLSQVEKPPFLTRVQDPLVSV